MNSEVLAIIRWVPAERGGRKSPPTSAGYSTVARFESDPDYEQGAWSLRVTDIRPLHGPDVIRAKVQFLLEDAPTPLLSEGERFELLEGERVVAKGIVLPARVTVPERISDFELALLG
jgi:hypothetical protein